MPMSISRRRMVGGVAGLAFGSLLLPKTSFAEYDEPINPELIPKKIMFSALAKAMDAAKVSGAEHVEVSMTRNLLQNLFQDPNLFSRIRGGNISNISIAVRVMIRGRWGYASTNQFETDEMVRIAKAACSQATANSKHRPRQMHWTSPPNIVGEYITPGIDPFSVTQEEKVDFINSWRMAVSDYRDSKYEGGVGASRIEHWRVERAFINSAGSQLYSVKYGVNGAFGVYGRIKGANPLSNPDPVVAKGLNPQQAGWEVFREAKIHEQIPQLIIEHAEASMIGISPVDIGRYDVVCDASTCASLITSTVVSAAEIDRAIGLEANAGGTSYLGPILSDHLGSVVGHDKLNVNINRTARRGLGTMPWDAEGVAAKSFNLVKGGRLIDYLTNREYAPLLDEWYAANGVTPGSNSCSYASTGSSFPTVACGNVKIEHGKDDIGVDELVSNVKRGYLLPNMFAIPSFQRKDGYMNGLAREIINGKLGSYVQLGVLFSATDLLRNMTGIGGEKSLIHTGADGSKSQPRQAIYCSVESVPMSFSNVAIIDPNKKI